MLAGPQCPAWPPPGVQGSQPLGLLWLPGRPHPPSPAAPGQAGCKAGPAGPQCRRAVERRIPLQQAPCLLWPHCHESSLGGAGTHPWAPRAPTMHGQDARQEAPQEPPDFQGPLTSRSQRGGRRLQASPLAETEVQRLNPGLTDALFLGDRQTHSPWTRERRQVVSQPHPSPPALPAPPTGGGGSLPAAGVCSWVLPAEPRARDDGLSCTSRTQRPPCARCSRIPLFLSPV